MRHSENSGCLQKSWSGRSGVYCSWRRYYSEFTALQNAKVLDSKAPNVTIEVKILALLKENASITTTEMAKGLFVNRRTVQRGLNVLKDKGIIERKGGKQYDYWEICE